VKREILLESLYTNYGKKRFLNWCRSLNIFRFIKSHPYPDDLNPDRFIALINFQKDEEVFDLINILEIKPEINIEDILRMDTVFSEKVTVNNVLCYFEINKFLKNLVFTVSGTEEDQFALDDSTYQRAKKLDILLSEVKLKYVSSPYDDDYCITPEFYPEVWQQEKL
jgi:hypothetical protein